MINTIIFDFGDIIINLEKEKCFEEFRKLGLNELHEDLKAQNSLFEIGKNF
jgi:glucose-1-phosphatase